MSGESATLGKRMEVFKEACRRKGLKVTQQRLEVFRELARTVEHPDAETIYRRLRRRMPTVSLDTVYRNLCAFEELGVATRVSAILSRARFDADCQRHQHFICSECGLVRDFHSREIDSFRPPREVRGWGEVESVHLEVRGVCARCLEKKRA